MGTKVLYLIRNRKKNITDKLKNSAVADPYKSGVSSNLVKLYTVPKN